MTQPVRPGFVPTSSQSPVQPGRADARAAQRAFFDQALTQARGAVSAAPTAASRPAVEAAPARPAPAAARFDPVAPPAQDRVPRPGSIIDIRV